MPIETTAMSESRSAYSTSACPSSRFRSAATASATRMPSERIISTYVLLLRAAGRAAVPLSCRVRALLLRQPAVAECPLDQVIERRRLAVLGRRARIAQSFCQGLTPLHRGQAGLQGHG